MKNDPFDIVEKYRRSATEPAWECPNCVGADSIAADGVTDSGANSEILDTGELVAVLICSKVVRGHLWFALHDSWKPDPGDTTPVFYASELPLLQQKTPDQFRELYKIKIKTAPAFGGGKVRQ